MVGRGAWCVALLSLAFLKEYPHDREGPPITPDEAAQVLWGLKPSAPGIDQVSAPMMRIIAAWEVDTWIMWVIQQNNWRADLAAGRYDLVLLRILEMRLPKGKLAQLVEAARPIGMEPLRMRIEQLLCAQEVRKAQMDGRITLPPTQHAYTPGTSCGTEHRLNQNCQLDAARRRVPIAMYKEDKIDAFGSIDHAKLGQDMLDRGIDPPTVYRTITFWAMAQIFVITAVGITAAYSQDHAAVQGDLVAQLVYLLYVVPAWTAAEALGCGYRMPITGGPDLHVPMAVRERLLGNAPSKGAFIVIAWRMDRGKLAPRRQRAELTDQGALAVWYGAIRGHMPATSCRQLHGQIAEGTTNHMTMVDTPPEKQLIDLAITAAAPIPGTADDPQLQAMQEAGMPRAPPWAPGKLQRAARTNFIDEAQ
eukprot:gene29553-14065_t